MSRRRRGLPRCLDCSDGSWTLGGLGFGRERSLPWAPQSDCSGSLPRLRITILTQFSLVRSVSQLRSCKVFGSIVDAGTPCISSTCETMERRQG